MGQTVRCLATLDLRWMTIPYGVNIGCMWVLIKPGMGNEEMGNEEMGNEEMEKWGN